MARHSQRLAGNSRTPKLIEPARYVRQSHAEACSMVGWRDSRDTVKTFPGTSNRLSSFARYETPVGWREAARQAASRFHRHAPARQASRKQTSGCRRVGRRAVARALFSACPNWSRSVFRPSPDNADFNPQRRRPFGDCRRSSRRSARTCRAAGCPTARSAAIGNGCRRTRRP